MAPGLEPRAGLHRTCSAVLAAYEETKNPGMVQNALEVSHPGHGHDMALALVSGADLRGILC